MVRAAAPRSVADLLVSAVPDLRDRLLEHRIRRAWPAVVGSDGARRAQPRSFADGCLTVVVDNSPWLHELTLRSDELTRRLAERFGGVQSLRFVAGKVEGEPASGRAGTVDDSIRAEISRADPLTGCYNRRAFEMQLERDLQARGTLLVAYRQFLVK